METATSGRVEIESKDDAKKGGQSSPDRAEALVLAFAWVVPRQQTIVWSAPYTISPPIGIKAAKGWLQITDGQAAAQIAANEKLLQNQG